jgi:dethiobiotin synthetase
MAECHFITSTGTEIGKTIVSTLFVNDLERDYSRVGYWKPVASGCEESPYGYRSPDEIEIIEDTGLSPDQVHSTFRFDAPLSPDKAAEREDRQIKVDPILERWRNLKDSYEALVVEGIGGVAVPFSPNYDVTDLIGDLSIPPVLVVPSVLGTISYTRTAESYLSNQETPSQGIFLTPKKGRSIETTNQNHLSEFYPNKFVELLPDAYEQETSAHELIDNYRAEYT